MKDMMIDLETLGTTEEAPVLSIGACMFDIEKGVIGDTLHVVLDVEDQLARGRKATFATLSWWLGQNRNAQEVFQGQRTEVSQALQWLASMHNSAPYVWGNGAHFDISILENLYRQYGMPIPWAFYGVMDLRTFKRFSGKGKKIEKTGVEHNALDDAKSQAQYVIDIMKNRG